MLPSRAAASHLHRPCRLAAPLACPPAGVAAFVEALAEPFYILAACRLLFGLRVGVETAAMGAKGLLTLALVRHPGYPPALAFSWAQLAYAGITLAGYAAYFLPQLLRRGRPVQRGPPVAAAAAGGDGEILRLSGTFTLQAGWGRVGRRAGGRARGLQSLDSHSTQHTAYSVPTLQVNKTLSANLLPPSPPTTRAGGGEACAGGGQQDGCGRVPGQPRPGRVRLGGGPRFGGGAHAVPAL